MPYPRRAPPRALPENTPFRDTGCTLHPACLTCPEPFCRYDCNRGAARLHYLRLRNHAASLLKQGLSPKDVSHQSGLGIRTVFRIKSLLTKAS